MFSLVHIKIQNMPIPTISVSDPDPDPDPYHETIDMDPGSVKN